MAKFKTGDRVRVKASSWAHDYTRDEVVRVIDIDNYGKIWIEDPSGEYTSGICQSETNLLLATEGGAQVARRTFKLIKDMPNARKGALFQEECEDGTQPYLIITPEHKKGETPDFRFTDRKLVEEQPNWFVEVFQVEPQYMTREELDQWEAFKTRKSAERVVRSPFKVGDLVHHISTEEGTYIGKVAGINKYGQAYVRFPEWKSNNGIWPFDHLTEKDTNSLLVKVGSEKHLATRRRRWTPAQRKAQSIRIKAAIAAKKAGK